MRYNELYHIQQNTTMGSKKFEIWVFVAIVIVAAFFRFYQLDSIPNGLWPDEAANGVDALKSLDSGEFKIFYSDNNGREGLFINLQALSIKVFGPHPWALRSVSAIIGTLTVIGLYLLTKHLFGRETAAVASLFMAISFWHVNFSRIGFRAIMLPFILVWGFYFLWRGLRNGRLVEFLIAGLIGGIGFHTYFSFRITPLIAIVLFWNYWSYIKSDFSYAKYTQARTELVRGFALFMLSAIIVAIPMGWYFLNHPEDFLKREGRSISVLAQNEPLKELSLSVVKTLGMFNFSGDFNQRHNIPGSPELALPIGILFAVGFIRELIHWLQRKHGHFSTIHTFLFSWFFVMLMPGFLSTEAPHALRTIGVIPVVMIFAAKGFGWLINLIIRIHKVSDPHVHTDQMTYRREVRLLAQITILAFMISLGFFEYSRYFMRWGTDQALGEAFTRKYVSMSEYLNRSDSELPKYVLVNEGDVLVDGVPNNAQTIKFLTLTHSQSCSVQKNIYYLRNDQLSSHHFPEKYIIIPLSDNKELDMLFRRSFRLYPEKEESFTVYKKI